MKKNLKLSVIAFAALMLYESVAAFQQRPEKDAVVVPYLNYAWFKDEDLTDPTGTVSDVPTEIHRLSVLFPYSVFSSTL